MPALRVQKMQYQTGGITSPAGKPIDVTKRKAWDSVSFSAGKDTGERRVVDLIHFIKEHDDGVAEYDDALVRKLIERITVFDDHFTILFKSGIDIDVEA